MFGSLLGGEGNYPQVPHLSPSISISFKHLHATNVKKLQCKLIKVKKITIKLLNMTNVKLNII